MATRPTQTSFTKTEAVADSYIVAGKHRFATNAGVAMLEAGGNVIDAAVAVCLAVGTVEPGSSGIGGGGYLVYHMGGATGVFGFPMRAPQAAHAGTYRLTGAGGTGSFGWPQVEGDANIHGPLSIAVPGAIAGLCAAHARFGALPLNEVVEPALRLARDGFAPTFFDHYAAGMSADMFIRYDELRHIMMPNGQWPSAPGSAELLLRQPDLANVLEAVAKEGPNGFYRGAVAEALATGTRDLGGILSEDDLASYTPMHWEGGLEFDYRGRRIVVPPFACAGTTTAVTLKLLAGFDVAGMGHGSFQTLHHFIWAARLAYADRFVYMSDPDYVDAPWNGLVADDYLDARRALISERIGRVPSGDPWTHEEHRPAELLPPSLPAWEQGTTHLCVMDAAGNAVSLTNTIMSGFGSGIVPKGTGVIMNNGMMWFDPAPGHINSVAPGKAPLNNMTPALVLGESGATHAVGASGGRLITNCVSQVLSNLLDHGMGPQAAIDAPRVDASLPTASADMRIGTDVIQQLREQGHDVRVVPYDFLERGWTPFASPLAIVRGESPELRAGVDTFHSAYAAGG